MRTLLLFRGNIQRRVKTMVKCEKCGEELYYETNPVNGFGEMAFGFAYCKKCSYEEEFIRNKEREEDEL